jgi:hypothetical protein
MSKTVKTTKNNTGQGTHSCNNFLMKQQQKNIAQAGIKLKSISSRFED